jgi:hypothetical protein
MYAYDFEPKRKGINHREIFVVMPFAEAYDTIYHHLIEPAVTKANGLLSYQDSEALFSYRTKDDLRTTSGWINILEHLTTSQIVLGVLTDRNPNVYYELGIAHATQPKSRQILIADKHHEPTFDTKDLIYYQYEENLSSSIEPLATRIEDAVKTYKIEEERLVYRARSQLGPFELKVLLRHGTQRNFALGTTANDKEEYEKQFGERAFEITIEGMENLCHQGILGFNPKSRRDDTGTQLEYSYYWTNLGNDVLYQMKVINEETLRKRRMDLPLSLK